LSAERDSLKDLNATLLDRMNALTVSEAKTAAELELLKQAIDDKVPLACICSDRNGGFLWKNNVGKAFANDYEERVI
jgi:hypothetical protein